MPKINTIAPQLLVVALLIGANVLILGHLSPVFSYGAALVLLALPGGVWSMTLGGATRGLERLALVAGLSLAGLVATTLLVVYLPGAITVWALLVAVNLLTLLGLAVGWRKFPPLGPLPKIKHKYLWALALILLLAAALRLPRLGYAEFHEDEAEALMLGVRLFQGEDYALFLHRKGPAQMLVPVAFWLLTSQITEAMARLPFALSSLASVIAIFLVGRRWFGPAAGLLAALLWAVNGYSIAFGRMVQYQALIFFMGVLGLFALYLAARQRSIGLQVAGALLLAASLLAHFDALLLLPAAAWLWAAGFLAMRQKPHQSDTAVSEDEKILGDTPYSPRPATLFSQKPSRRALLSLSLSLGLLIALLAAFYIPYTLDPEFQNTTTYLTESRVKPGLLYNNLDKLRRFDHDYSSHFYLPLLALGLLGSVAGLQGRRGNPPTNNPANQQPNQPTTLTFYILRFTLLFAIATTYFWPALWQWGDNSLALLPWLLLGGLCFFAAPTMEARVAWLLLGAPLVGYVFLVDDPRTHLYILYPGAVLLAGAGWERIGEWMNGRIATGKVKSFANPQIRKFAALMAIIWLALIAAYEAAIFLPTESGFATLRQNWEDSTLDWLYNDLPRPREYFGYPKREGWKAIGALRAEGRYPGDFRSVNEDFVIPIWYNYGQPRSCYDTPAHFFIRLADLKALPERSNYRDSGQVTREGEVRIQISSRVGLAPETPETFAVEDFETQFDALATPQQFTRQSEPSQPVGAQFGGLIEFSGFDLPVATVAPGDTLYLNLHWRALAAPGENYRAFVHLTDGATLWAQQDDDPACRLPTSVWREGQRSAGQFRLVVSPDTPPGRYPLIIGLYRADTLARLPITAGAGVIGDDFLWLGDVEVR